jgi:hypothetical protein
MLWVVCAGLLLLMAGVSRADFYAQFESGMPPGFGVIGTGPTIGDPLPYGIEDRTGQPGNHWLHIWSDPDPATDPMIPVPLFFAGVAGVIEMHTKIDVFATTAFDVAQPSINGAAMGSDATLNLVFVGVNSFTGTMDTTLLDVGTMSYLPLDSQPISGFDITKQYRIQLNVTPNDDLTIAHYQARVWEDGTAMPAWMFDAFDDGSLGGSPHTPVVTGFGGIFTMNPVPTYQDGEGRWHYMPCSGYFDDYGVIVPEPATYALMGLGLVALAYLRKRSKK